jgi:hypothetical protein
MGGNQGLPTRASWMPINTSEQSSGHAAPVTGVPRPCVGRSFSGRAVRIAPGSAAGTSSLLVRSARYSSSSCSLSNELSYSSSSSDVGCPLARTGRVRPAISPADSGYMPARTAHIRNAVCAWLLRSGGYARAAACWPTARRGDHHQQPGAALEPVARAGGSPLATTESATAIDRCRCPRFEDGHNMHSSLMIARDLR